MFTYRFNKQPVNAGFLCAEVTESGLPIWTDGAVSGPYENGDILIRMSTELTNPQLSLLASIVNNHTGDTQKWAEYKARLHFQSLNNQDASILRAISLACLFMDNRIIKWVNDFKIAVASATNLSDLKTKVEALSLSNVSQSDLKGLVFDLIKLREGI